MAHPSAMISVPLLSTVTSAKSSSSPAQIAAGAVISGMTGTSFTVIWTVLLVEVPLLLVAKYLMW